MSINEPTPYDPTADILTEISKTDIKDAIVRIKISIPESIKGQLRETEIMRALQPAFSSKLAIEIIRTARVRSAGWSGKGITPLEALDKYMQVNSVPEERQWVLSEHAGRLIDEAS